ncbi:MAG: NUDIX domain-containing protein, partial [Bacilli bacterium]|nr:NUDIX domain-containing protein [Bacilli bacterium]
MKRATFYYKDEKAPKPNKPNHIGTSIFIEFDNKLLLEKRQDSGIWSLIGGGLEIDESLLEGIKRETFEETGIVLSDNNIDFYGIYDDPSRIACYPDGNILRVITVVYFARLDKYPTLICS